MKTFITTEEELLWFERAIRCKIIEDLPEEAVKKYGHIILPKSVAKEIQNG